MKDKGIYKKLLNSWTSNRTSLNESLLRHICLGYAEKWEEIEEDTLIKDLLSKYDALDEVVRFFWIIAKNIKPEYKPRVKALWQYITDNNSNTPILGKISQWLNIFDELDNDLVDYCLLGVKHITIHHSHYIIEYLIKYIDSNIEKVGTILLEIVKEGKILDTYRKEDTIKIVENLYTNGFKKIADNICNTLCQVQGLDFLREIYNILQG